MTPSVYTLQLHLPGEQVVSFHKNTNLSNLVDSTDFTKTMLTEFFAMNKRSKQARKLKCLKRRKVIGQVVTVRPNEGKRYFLRLLLSHVHAPKSFDHLLTVDGQLASSYQEAVFRLGLLQSDTYIEDALDEATAFHMPCSLRSLFAMLLIFCTPSNPFKLWEKYEADLSSDLERTSSITGCDSNYIRRYVLQDINRSLEQMGKHISDYRLVPDSLLFTEHERLTKEIESEQSVRCTEDDLMTISWLNTGQQATYNAIMSELFLPDGKSFFVDGPGGTGKTFLYRALLATLRTHGHIALAVASSGVAASILLGGRTVHSRFKIPLDASATKACQISKQSSTAKLIVVAKLILWDESSMAKRDTIEAFDLLLRDIMDSDMPFGGKVVGFGGDFRQTLPVIQNATRDIQVQSNFVSSALWSSLQKVSLKENM
ncbi:ATP-dependent DNA helicase PIF3-like [Coffea eugenioides]|uniref:ATP-dependent DNA helicase PIF3-like n=1 Tax=Coffea eugenioides TaxID=49369 RepID=UPI000F60D803|nr:ATP-dependent DNA helicase PIF3-like [Coffea eugenioides]